jgi:hypothetical protein
MASVKATKTTDDTADKCKRATTKTTKKAKRENVGGGKCRSAYCWQGNAPQKQKQDHPAYDKPHSDNCRLERTVHTEHIKKTKQREINGMPSRGELP